MVNFIRGVDPAMQGEMPDAIRVVMLMNTPPGARAPIDMLPPAFACPPLMFAAPTVAARPRPPWHDDLIEGEAFEAGAPRVREGRRRLAGHRAGGRSGLRCLLPRPGVQRAVCFGDFKNQLGAQLAHPERLRETHRLPCCVQLYRVTIAQPRIEVARRLLGGDASAADLLLFTPDVARRLQLPPPRRLARPLEKTTRESPWLEAGEEIVELRVIHDHTQQAARDAHAGPRSEESAEAAAPLAVATQRGAPSPLRNAARAPASEAKPSAETAPATDIQPPSPTLRTTVPARFLMSPDFRLTREEALFDMTVAASAHGALAALRRVARTFLRRGELKRWRALMDGRERDEQLWQERPPKVALTDRRSREWVQRALTLGGYDTEHMLREWELYWRRRGV